MKRMQSRSEYKEDQRRTYAAASYISVGVGVIMLLLGIADIMDRKDAVLWAFILPVPLTFALTPFVSMVRKSLGITVIFYDGDDRGI